MGGIRMWNLDPYPSGIWIGVSCRYPCYLPSFEIKEKALSHVVTIRTKFKSLSALRRAFERLGGTWQEKKTYKWYGRWVNDYHNEDAAYQQGVNTQDYGKCDYAVSFPGCQYEVGVIQEGDEYRLIWDFYDYELGKVMGQAEKSPVKQFYSIEASKESLESQGWTWTETMREDGKIELKANPW